MLTSCDVLVVGGGVAGTAAAVSAARNGARTVLVEKDRFLGGTGYAGLLQQICGLYGTSEATPAETLNSGIVREIEQALFRKSPQRKIKKIGQVYVLPYSREDLQTVLRELCSAEGNLSFYDDTASTEVEARDGRVTAVSLTRSGKTYSIFPKSVIDCSGNGAAAVMAGAGYELAPSVARQLAGYVIRVIGLTDADETLSIKVPYYLNQAITEGALRPSLKYTTFSLGELPGEGFCKLSIDADEGPEREEQARQDGTAVHDYLRSKIPAFSDSSIGAVSFRVLDRESRRVCGEYTLTEEDVRNPPEATLSRCTLQMKNPLEWITQHLGVLVPGVPFRLAPGFNPSLPVGWNRFSP